MKRLALAIILGLMAGWFISHLLGPEAEPPVAKAPTQATLLGSRMGPTAPRARSASSLDAQRAQAQEDRTFSPYRQQLFSMDLVRSLSTTQLIEAFLSGQIRDESEVAAALAKVAEIDPIRALELVREIPGRSSHDRARGAIIAQWVKTDANAALAHIRSLPPQAHRQQLTRDLARAWGQHDPAAALSNLESIESLVEPREKLVESILARWAQRDLAAAESWIANHAPEEGSEALQRSLVEGQLTKLHGAEAVDFILDRPDSHALSHPLQRAFEMWTYSNPEAAIARFLTLPETHPVRAEITELGNDTMMSLLLMDRSQLDKILVLKDLVPEGDARSQFLLGAADAASSNELPMAKRIIAEMPESPERAEAVGTFTELWMRKDHVGLSEWLGTLEPSPSRDAGVSRFARLLAKSDRERASAWAETISDKKDRARALKRLSE